MPRVVVSKIGLSGGWMGSPDFSITDNQLGGQTLEFLHDYGQLLIGDEARYVAVDSFHL
jgi:hypothetical protein